MEITNKATDFIKLCTPRNQISGGQKLVLLFKLITLMNIDSDIDSKYFTNAVLEFALSSLTEGNNIENYAHFLTLVFNVSLTYINL